jgi:energy-coupling factor transporter ATP-binding protein EcfA2
MLKHIHAKGVGPAKEISWDIGQRLSLVVGDNGLGKTLLLDLIWWILTGRSAGEPIQGNRDQVGEPSISWTHHDLPDQVFEAHLPDGKEASEWIRTSSDRADMLGSVVIYARSDGSYAIHDPVEALGRGGRGTLTITPEQVWNGLGRGKTVKCRGLIEDWRAWQYEPDERTYFEAFQAVLGTLSEPGQRIELSESTTTKAGDDRKIPCVRMPYGVVPISQLSAGMRRILSLAYLIVWSWRGNHLATKRKHLDYLANLTLLIDEVELHLHPQWQRSILPSLFEAVAEHHLHRQTNLFSHLGPQIIATTHAPLVMASVETFWRDEEDSLLRYELGADRQVVVHEGEVHKEGDTSQWLTSEAFGLTEARSREAEAALIKA